VKRGLFVCSGAIVVVSGLDTSFSVLEKSSEGEFEKKKI